MVVTVTVVGGVIFLFRGSSQGKACTPEVSREVATFSSTTANEVTITFSDGKFSPSCVKIPSGSRLKWVNRSNQEIKIGADPHPIHTGNKEVSGDNFVLKLSPGESSEVTLNKKGKFGYHNHLYSSETGVIIVE